MTVGLMKSVPEQNAPGSYSKSKTHLGDAHLAWDQVKSDKDHGHYLVLTYDERKDALQIHAFGSDTKNRSGHDVVTEYCEDLQKNENQACWGGYSFKVTYNDQPGEKHFKYKHACFANIFPGCENYDKIFGIKNRVKSIVFEDSHHYQEFHDCSTLDTPEWWTGVRAAAHDTCPVTGDVTTALKCDFGGDHSHDTATATMSEKHAAELKRKQANEAAVAEQRMDAITNAMELERERRSEKLEAIQRAEDRERRNSQEKAKKAADMEKQRRMSLSGSNRPSQQHRQRASQIQQELLQTDTLEKLENKQRAVTRISVNDKVAERQREAEVEWKAKDAEAEAERKSNGEIADAAMEKERMRRSQPENLEDEANKLHRCKEISGCIAEELIDAHGIMERAVNQRGAKIAMEVEKRARMSDNNFPEAPVQLRKSNMHIELRGSVIQAQ